MAISAENVEFVNDLFVDLSSLSTRRMMSGLSIYADGQIFAMMFGTGQLMLKATGQLAQELAGMGSTQFTYTNKKSGKLVAMPYWTLPEDALDDPQEACRWARRSLAEHG